MKKRIGVMLVTIDQYFQKELWKGMQKYASIDDVEFLFFCGSPYEAPMTDSSHYNSIYNLINTSQLDGLIISSSTLGNYIGKERLYDYIKQYFDIPIVSISVEYEGLQVVTIDNVTPIIELVDHLIEVHHYQQIAMISGPMTNVDGVERLEGYKKALEKHGITYDPKLVVEGKFNQVSAIKAIETLYIANQMKPDAIVCGNDDMAIGAYIALKKLGLEVGEDVFITGFDDLEESKSFNPPLTTVKVPLFEMGYKAVELLCTKLNKLHYDSKACIGGEVVIRESCGCLNVLSFNINDQFESILNEHISSDIFHDDFEQWVLHHIDTFSVIITNAIGAPKDYRINQNVLLSLILAFKSDVLAGASKGAFLETFNKIAVSAMEKGNDIKEWRNALYAVHKYMKKSPLAKELSLLVDDLFYLANTMLGDIIMRTQHHINYKFRDMYYSTSMLISEFHTVSNMTQLVNYLRKWSLNYELSMISLCLFDEAITAVNNGQFGYPEVMNAVYTKVYDHESYDLQFETKYMLPVTEFSSYQEDYVFFPIHFKERHYGFLLTSTEAAEQLIFITLREQIGNTVDRIYINKQLAIYNDELERLSIVDALTGLYNYRGFYNAGNEACDYVKRMNLQMAVIYGDMDGLKPINDLYGHHEGDYAIAFIGEAILEVMISGGFAGRVGGDEFVIVICHERAEEQALYFIDAMMHALKRENETNGKSYQLSISFGYMVFESQSTIDFDERIKAADQDLYLEKYKKEAKPGHQ